MAPTEATPLQDVNDPDAPFLKMEGEFGLFRRWFVIGMAGLSVGLAYIMRIDLSVAVRDMPIVYGWEATWNGPLLASFFLGYMVASPFSGGLALRFGPWRMLGFIVFVTGTLNALIPLVASSPAMVMALRIVFGAVQSGTLPCCYQLLTVWALPSETSRGVAALNILGFTGGAFSGFMLAELLIAIGQPPELASIDHYAGAPTTAPSRVDVYPGIQLVFWVPSLLAVIWCTVWLLFVPERSEELRAQGSGGAGAKEASSRHGIATWSSLLTKPALWALYAAHFADHFVMYGLLTELPLFLRSRHKDATVTLAAETLPYVFNMMTTLLVAPFADGLVARGTDRTIVRKTFQGIAMIGASVGLLAASFCSFEGPSVVAFTCLSMGMLACRTAGGLAGFLEVCPHHAGQAYAVSNTVATLPGVFAPLLAQVLTTQLGDVAGFRVAFAIYGFGASIPALLLFVSCFSSEPVKVD